MKNDYAKFGLWTSVVWNVFLLISSFISYTFQSPSLYKDMFRTSWDTLMAVFFFVLWSITWYLVGYYCRKKFILIRLLYRSKFHSLGNKIIDRCYWLSFVAKYSRIIANIALVAVPGYFITTLERDVIKEDFIVIALFVLIAIVLVRIHKNAREKLAGQLPQHEQPDFTVNGQAIG